jgi:hypothetical protein
MALFQELAAWRHCTTRVQPARQALCPGAPGLGAVRTIYRGTTTGSPARRLLVDLSAWEICLDAGRIRNLNPDMDAQFAIDMTAALLKCRQRPGAERIRPWVERPEQYCVVKVEEDVQEMHSVTHDSMDSSS